MKKLLAIVMCICISLTCVACGGGNDYGDKVVIRAVINQSGIGTAWLEKAAERYEVVAAEKQFGDKTGVVIEIDAIVSPEKNLAPGDAHDIVTPNGDLFTYMQQNLLMDLNELYTRPSAYDSKPIGERMSADVQEYYKNLDGHYYALPHYQYFSGVTYNRELFEEHNLFFAADESNGTLISTSFGDAYLIASPESKKSNGPDLTPDTVDDGLPSTLEEMIILCGYMKSMDIEPFMLSGKYLNYSNAMATGLTASLAGYDQMQSIWNLNGGNIEIVAETFGTTESNGQLAYTEENLFTGIDYIKKPLINETSVVSINEDNGYKMQDLTAKYYTAAFMEICEKQEFYSDFSKHNSDTYSHTAAQEAFTVGYKNGKYNAAMLIEGSYWYNESIYAGLESKYPPSFGKLSELDIRFMPLPSFATNAQRDAAVAQGKTLKNTLISEGAAPLVVQAHVANDETKKEAIFDFLDFLYSTEERVNFTTETGLLCPMEYEYDENNLASKGKYSVEMIKLIKNSNLVNQTPTNKFMKVNRANLVMGIFAGDRWWNNGTTKDCCTGIRNGLDAKTIMERTRITSATWDIYKGNVK